MKLFAIVTLISTRMIQTIQRLVETVRPYNLSIWQISSACNDNPIALASALFS